MNIAEVIAELKMSELLVPTSTTKLTNKVIYRDIASFSTPKIAVDGTVNYKLVWKRLKESSSILSYQEYEYMYLLVNTKLPVPERLHRVGKGFTPHCIQCPGIISDICHFFCSCLRTREIWNWLRLRINSVCTIVNCSDWEVLNLLFPETRKEQTIVWMIGSYLAYVWQASKNCEDVSVEKLFGFLTFKYRESGAYMTGQAECLGL